MWAKTFKHPSMHLFWCVQACQRSANGWKGFRWAYQRYLWNVPSWRGASARCDPSRTVCSCPRRASSSGRQEEETLAFAAGLQSITREKSDFWKSKAMFVHCIVSLAYPPGVHKMQFRNFRQGKGCKIIFFSLCLLRSSPRLKKHKMQLMNWLFIAPRHFAAKITWKETTLASNNGWNRAE